MITIYDLDLRVAKSMTYELGDRIFKSKVPDSELEECTAILNDNAEIKFYNFDQSVTVQLGSKKFLIEKEGYWRIELE